MKKFLSCLLAAGTLAFSSPMAFANWTGLDCNLGGMINFTKLQNRKCSWCWVSCSLQLMEYWTKKLKGTSVKRPSNLGQYSKMLSGKDRLRNFSYYEPLFDKVNEVLTEAKRKYPNDPLFKDRENLSVEKDETCNIIINYKAIEAILNSMYSEMKEKFRFYNFSFLGTPNYTISDPEQLYSVEQSKTFQLKPYDLIKEIMTKHYKCPLTVVMGDCTSREFMKMLERAKKRGFNYCNLQGHALLFTGIDLDSKKVRLKDPATLNTLEFNEDYFNKYCYTIVGVLNKVIDF